MKSAEYYITLTHCVNLFIQVYMYDLSSLCQHLGEWHEKSPTIENKNVLNIGSGNRLADTNSNPGSASPAWKVLHAQSSGKSYGVCINPLKTLIFTFGSESTLKVWSLSHEQK